MILRASNRIREISVLLDSKMSEEELFIKSLIPDWFLTMLHDGSVIVLPQEEFDSLPDEVRDEMEVLRR